MSDTPTLREQAEAFLKQCGACDAGLPMMCTCPVVDPRPLVLALLTALETSVQREEQARAHKKKLADALYGYADKIIGTPIGYRVAHHLRGILDAHTH
jgi:hypothetical protein